MYQGTGELKSINVQVQSRYKSDVNHLQLKSSSSVMTLITKCQSPTVKVKHKCDDLVNQVSITNSDHYQLLV